MTVLNGARILLGVTGSIAAYKAADLVSKLTQQGAQVDVILTSGAEKFISGLTFQSVSGRKTYSDADLWGGQAHILHVGLGHQANLLVIAPCTANTLAKLAHGLADNLLTVTALAMKGTILVAPAMDAGMYEQPATQENIRILKERGVIFAGPTKGRMASGLSGLGRMLEPNEILGQIRLELARGGILAGKQLVITAGGTQEPIDPVRFITNRSSGKQGYALAQAALDSGSQVVLITTPTSLTAPVGARMIEVETAQQMYKNVLSESVKADVLIMAAAIADFRPKKTAKNKMKKREGIPHIELEETEDILKAVAEHRSGKKRPRVVVGFAAESRDLLANASEKLKSKKMDFIVANDISSDDAGFGVETNRVTLLFPTGKKESLPLMSKAEVAEAIIAHIVDLLE